MTTADKIKQLINKKASQGNVTAQSVLNKLNNKTTPVASPIQRQPFSYENQTSPYPVTPQANTVVNSQIEKSKPFSMKSLGESFKSAPIDLAKSMGKTSLRTFQELGEWIDKGGAQAISALSAPIESYIELSTLGELEKKRLSPGSEWSDFKKIWKNAADIWGDRAIEIGHPLEEIFKPEQPTMGSLALVKEPVEKNIKEAAESKTVLEAVKNISQATGLGMTAIFGNPFYLFNITGISKGSFKIPQKQKAIVLKGLLNPQEQSAAQVLGVKPTATQEEIKIAYRALARKYHPDITGGDDSMMKALNSAYDYLTKQKVTGSQIVQPPVNTTVSRTAPVSSVVPSKINRISTLTKPTGITVAPMAISSIPPVVKQPIAPIIPPQSNIPQVPSSKPQTTPVAPQQINARPISETANTQSIQPIESQSVETKTVQSLISKLESQLKKKEVALQGDVVPPKLIQEVNYLKDGIDALNKKLEQVKIGNVKQQIKDEILYRGDRVPGEVQEVKKTFNNIKTYSNNQPQALKDLASKGNVKAKQLLESSKSSYNDYDKFLDEYFKNQGYDAIKYENKHRSLVGDEYRDVVKGQSYAKLKETAKLHSWGRTPKRIEQVKAKHTKIRPVVKIQETPWKKKGMSKLEYEALEARKKIKEKNKSVKSYEDYLKEAQKKEPAKETPEQIRARLAKEKKAVAERRAKGEYTSRELELGIDKAIALKDELRQFKIAGKDEAYFHDLSNKYYSQFLDKKIDKDLSKIVDDFIENNFVIGKNKELSEAEQRAYFNEVKDKNDKELSEKYKSELDKRSKVGDEKADLILELLKNQKGQIDPKFMYDMLLLKPFERALNKGVETGFKFLYEKVHGSQLLESTQRILKKSSIINSLGEKIIYQYNQPQWYKDLSAALEKDIIKTNVVAEELFDYLGKGLNKQELMELQQAIINGGQSTNPKLDQRAAVARQILDDYGEQFYRFGAISRETFEANKGQYLMRAYYDKELQRPLYDFISNKIPKKAKLKRAKKRGIEKVVSIEKGEELVEKGWQNRGLTQTGLMRVWRDFTKEERTKMGEILEAPHYLVSQTIKQVGEDVALLKKFSEVAKQTEFVKDEPFEDYIKLEGKNLGALNGKYVAPFIANDIKGLQNARKTASELSSRMLSEWKRFKVTDNPATHFRNMYFNTILQDLAGLSPHRVDVHISSLIDLLKKGDDFKEARDNGMFGTTSWAGQELGAVMGKDVQAKIKDLYYNKESGMYDSNKLKELGTDVLMIFDKILKGYEKGQERLSKIYEGEEQWAKLSLYKWAKYEQGMTPKQAAEFSRKWLMNYGAVTPFISDFSKKWYGIPFIRFQVLAAPRLIEASITRTATIAKWILIAYFLEEEARKRLNLTKEQLQKIKKEIFPEWMKIGLYILAPVRDNNNNYQFLDLSYIVPYVQDIKAFDPRNYIFQNPAAQYSASLITGIDPFTQEPIVSEIFDDTTFKEMNAYIKYYYKQIVPPVFPGGYNWQKIQNAIFDSKENINDRLVKGQTVNASIFDAVFGIKFRPVDLDKNQQFRFKELKDKYNDLKYEYTKIQNSWGDYTRMTDEDKEKKALELLEKQKDILKKASEIKELDTIFLEN